MSREVCETERYGQEYPTQGQSQRSFPLIPSVPLLVPTGKDVPPRTFGSFLDPWGPPGMRSVFWVVLEGTPNPPTGVVPVSVRNPPDSNTSSSREKFFCLCFTVHVFIYVPERFRVRHSLGLRPEVSEGTRPLSGREGQVLVSWRS